MDPEMLMESFIRSLYFTVQAEGLLKEEFEIGMRLEAKDRLYPTLIAVATVSDIDNGQLLIHFDNWSVKYDYRCAPDCTDIHPVGWCEEHGRQLQPPKGMFSHGFKEKS